MTVFIMCLLNIKSKPLFVLIYSHWLVRTSKTDKMNNIGVISELQWNIHNEWGSKVTKKDPWFFLLTLSITAYRAWVLEVVSLFSEIWAEQFYTFIKFCLQPCLIQLTAESVKTPMNACASNEKSLNNCNASNRVRRQCQYRKNQQIVAMPVSEWQMLAMQGKEWVANVGNARERVNERPHKKY